MFGKLASDALGLSDIGRVIAPQDYHKVESDDYIMHEKGEKIFFLIKSKTDEYCFTNLALLHLDGDSAISKKRLLKRYDYYQHDISDVQLETAGTIDLDIELKFALGEQVFSIDVHKEHIEPLKDIYKALIEISQHMADEHHKLGLVTQSLDRVVSSLARQAGGQTDLAQQASALYGFYQGTLLQASHAAHRKDYSSVFECFIRS